MTEKLWNQRKRETTMKYGRNGIVHQIIKIILKRIWQLYLLKRKRKKTKCFNFLGNNRNQASNIKWKLIDALQNYKKSICMIINNILTPYQAGVDTSNVFP